MSIQFKLIQIYNNLLYNQSVFIFLGKNVYFVYLIILRNTFNIYVHFMGYVLMLSFLLFITSYQFINIEAGESCFVVFALVLGYILIVFQFFILISFLLLILYHIMNMWFQLTNLYLNFFIIFYYMLIIFLISFIYALFNFYIGIIISCYMVIISYYSSYIFLYNFISIFTFPLYYNLSYSIKVIILFLTYSYNLYNTNIQVIRNIFAFHSHLSCFYSMVVIIFFLIYFLYYLFYLHYNSIKVILIFLYVNIRNIFLSYFLGIYINISLVTLPRFQYTHLFAVTFHYLLPITLFFFIIG
jgi:hypothetical protein